MVRTCPGTPLFPALIALIRNRSALLRELAVSLRLSEDALALLWSALYIEDVMRSAPI